MEDGSKLLWAPQHLGALLSLNNIKYTKMHYFKKKNSKKKFFSEGPCKNVSPGPAVALDGPGCNNTTHLYDDDDVGW